MKKLPILFLMILFIASACNSGFEKILKSKDFAFKLQKANEYYDKKQFGKANTLYEELLTVYKGTKNFESIYYKYAYTFYNQKQYLAASYHFKNFSDLFPKSDKSEECEYLNSLCLYYMSPDYTLDQSNTIKSIGEMQTYINTHPNSKKLKEANKMIDNLRNKLEEKDNYGAALYYKISEFKAASVAYEQIIRKYPDSKNVEYYYFRVIDSKYKYAKSSIPSKQEERLNDVSSYYKEFVRKYPKSPYRSDVEKMISSLSLILDPNKDLLNMPIKLKAKIAEIKELLQSGIIPNVEVYFCNNGLKWDEEAENIIKCKNFPDWVSFTHFNHKNIINLSRAVLAV